MIDKTDEDERVRAVVFKLMGRLVVYRVKGMENWIARGKGIEASLSLGKGETNWN